MRTSGWLGFLAIATLLLTGTETFAQEQSIFLKLNGSYVLYLRPQVIFLEEAGHIMVPIQEAAPLLGLKVRVDYGPTVRVNVSGGNRALVISVGDSKAKLYLYPDGTASPKLTSVSMPTTAKMLSPSGVVIVPIRVLIEAFQIAAKWSPKSRILELSDARLMNRNSVKNFEQALVKTDTVDTDDLIPTSFSLSTESIRGLRQYAIALILRDVSRRRIPSGKQALYVLVEYRNGLYSYTGRDIYVSPDVGRTRDPCERSNGGFECIARFDVTGEPVVLVVARVRVRH